MERDTTTATRTFFLLLVMALAVGADPSFAQRAPRQETGRSDGANTVERKRGATDQRTPGRNVDTRAAEAQQASSEDTGDVGRSSPRDVVTRPARGESGGRGARGSSDADRAREESARPRGATGRDTDRSVDVRRQTENVRRPARTSSSGRRDWNRDRVYVRPVAPPAVHVRPRVRLNLEWPWRSRYDRGWKARYEFRQVVHLQNGNGWLGRETQLDIRTQYHHRVLRADAYRAEVEIVIDRIEIFDAGRYLGAVDYVPAALNRFHAVIYRHGGVDLDRSVFLVGDPYAGFEMVVTDYYDGSWLPGYQHARSIRTGYVDLRHRRVVLQSRPRLFVPRNEDRFVPISLLPRDGRMLADYGYGSPSVYLHGRPGYHYYGGGYGDTDYYLEDALQPRGATQNYDGLELREQGPIRMDDGVQVRLRRETQLKRLVAE
ncbi:MAG TPA: hypothetical protein VFG50_15215 [Rhodothermales bacterium]|nr:hypothetical protein [Rhodothermales bacterium]